MSARARQLPAALALAAVTVATVIGCGPATGSPNCPPGQWYVDKPGTGWICAAGSGSIFTPPSTAGSAP